MKKPFGKHLWLGLAAVIIFVFAQFLVQRFSAAPSAHSTGEVRPAEGTLVVRMLEIGHGDAILVQTGTENILIDTADVDERDQLRTQLAKAGIEKGGRIDKIILTHPHADHIGGMDVLLREYDVGEVYDNGQPSNSPIYRGYMKLLAEKHMPSRALTAGDTIDLGSGARFEVVAPTSVIIDEVHAKKKKKSDPNNECVVGRLVFGDFSMMFTGDAEDVEEESILAHTSADRLRSTVLKVGHHGSKTSSTSAFLEAVHPSVGLISCGFPNKYWHPHKSTRTALSKRGIDVYSTPVNGMITVVSDGKTCRVETEKGDKNDFGIYEKREKDEPKESKGTGRKQ